MKSKEKLEEYDEDKADILEKEPLPYITAMAADIPENIIEIVSASEVTHLVSSKKDDVTAIVKVDTSYPLIYETQETQEKEAPLQLKESGKAYGKSVITERESIQVTETEVNNSVDDYSVSKQRPENTASKGVIPVEGIITSEVLSSIEVSELVKPEKCLENAKPSVIPRDALNISESIVSHKEDVLADLTVKQSTASVAFSTMSGLDVTEVNDEIKEYELEVFSKEKTATPKLNFNLLESLEVGEVFVEDKSGKYYPELIVPTETAKKEILVSNQLITEIHDLQEKEGSLSMLKLPPTQEANVDITSKDSVVVSFKELHEKEGELPISETPNKVSVDEDVMLHSSLSNTLITSHIKETEFIPEAMSTKKASVGVTEHQHKFNLETNIHDSETVLEDFKSAPGSLAEVTLSVLDKPIVEEVQVNEREKDFVIKDDTQTAVAEADIRSVQSIITSQITEMMATGELKVLEKTSNESAIETFITQCAKIVSSPSVHDHEKEEQYTIRIPENITTSLIPNIPITVSETELSEAESKLTLETVPETMFAKHMPTHHLKTPISEEITTADQVDYIKPQQTNTENAAVQRDLQKEITVLQTTVDEHLQKLERSETLESNATTTFIGKEGLHVTEVISGVAEDMLKLSASKQNIYAKMDIDTDHKIALTSEINLGDATNVLNVLAPKQEEAQVLANTLVSLEISETKALDSQFSLSADVKPEYKSLTSDIVSSVETVSITEVMAHEKETNYASIISPETCKASSDLIGRPVAVSSELIPDLSLGFAKDDNINEKSKKANIENIAHKELTISTTHSIEKEGMMDTNEKPIVAAAVVNIDASQAIVVEVNKPQTVAADFDIQDNVLRVTATETRISKEAIIQEETVPHLSESDLILPETDKTQPRVSFTEIQVPEYNESMPIESENVYSTPIPPDHQTAEPTMVLTHGFQTSEVISQSENVEEARHSVELSYKKAIPKIDDVYRKAANTQEIILNQQAEEFNNEQLQGLKPDIAPVTSLTPIEQTEIIIAEKEMEVTKDIVKMTNIAPQYTETQAIVTSSVETVDKEEEFDGKFSAPRREVTVGIIPFNSAINTEILCTDNLEKFQECSVKRSEAIQVPIDLQKHLHETEVFYGEKESTLTSLKSDLQTASTSLIEVTAKEITVINTTEKEKEIKDLSGPTSLWASPAISEQLSLMNTEVVPTLESEDLFISAQVSNTASLTHGVKEAVQNSEPFVGEKETDLKIEKPTEKNLIGSINEQKPLDVTEIVLTESENVFEKASLLKSETIKPDYEKSYYVNVLETTPSEKEEQFDATTKLPEGKMIFPSHNIVPHLSLDVGEDFVSEKEISLTTNNEYKSQQAGFIIESQHHITVIDTMVKEKEDVLKPGIVPAANESHNIDVNLSRHIITTETLSLEDSAEILEKISNSEKAKTSQLITEAVHNEEQQALENIKEFPSTSKAESSQANLNVVDLRSLQQIEVITQETSDSFTKDDQKEETALGTHTVVKELVNIQPQVIESTTNLATDFEREESQAQFELELHKSYITSENKTEELSDNFTGEHHDLKIADKNIVDLKPLHQMEVITSENLQSLSTLDIQKKERAETSHITLVEVQNTTADILENITKIPPKEEIDKNIALLDFEIQKTYIVTENIAHETSKELSTEPNKPNQVSQQLLEMKPVEQTEVIAVEHVGKIKDAQPDEEKQTLIVTVENIPLYQTSIIAHEKETDTTFEKPVTTVKAETTVNTSEGISVFEITQEDSQDNLILEKGKETTAEKTISFLKHLQCTENIPETRVSELITPETHTKVSNITSTTISPLIITDNTILQQETDLHITKPTEHSSRKDLKVTNEIKVTTEFIAEETVPIPADNHKNIMFKPKISTVEDVQDVTISKEDVFTKGKLILIIILVP